MSSVPVFVGIDYHQEVLQVCAVDAAGSVLWNRKVRNDVAAVVQLVQQRGGEVQGAALEACCGAAALADALVAQGWSVSLAHSGYVARMKQNPDKTDFSDARLLADLLRVGYLPKVWLAPEKTRQLRRLVRYRKQLVDERRNAKLRIRALLRELRMYSPRGVRAWTRAWLAWLLTLPLSEDDGWMVDQHLARIGALGEEIRGVEERLKQRTADDALVQRLLTQPGIGLVTAVTMRAEIGRFDRFRSGKQLAHFCGLSPRNHSSGTRQSDMGIIKTGNPQLRAVLIEAAHRLMRYEARWRRLAASLLHRGKPRNVVVAAVANRWMRWLYHQMQPKQLAA